MGSLDGRSSRRLCRLFDSGPDSLIGTTATNVARHPRIDVGIAGVRVARQQRGCGHNLARLAVAALNYFEIEPRLLNPSASRRFADRLDSCYIPPDGNSHRSDAGADRPTIEMYRASTAQRDTAAEFRPRQACDVAQNPQQRHIVRDVELVFLAVDSQRYHSCPDVQRAVAII